MRQSAWLKRLYSMLRAERSLGQAALLLHARFVEPNRLKNLHETARRAAAQNVLGGRLVGESLTANRAMIP